MGQIMVIPRWRRIEPNTVCCTRWWWCAGVQPSHRCTFCNGKYARVATNCYASVGAGWVWKVDTVRLRLHSFAYKSRISRTGGSLLETEWIIEGRATVILPWNVILPRRREGNLWQGVGSKTKFDHRIIWYRQDKCPCLVAILQGAKCSLKE